MNPIIQVNHLEKTFGNHRVLSDIDFSVEKGDVTTIIGASGSGKSTLLRCINQLEEATGGQILFHGEDIAAKGFSLTAYRAKVGMVFQSFNLFSNMTVLENCIVGQRKVLVRSGRDRPVFSRKGWDAPLHPCQAEAAFGRHEAAGRHRPGPCDGTGGPAVR